MGKNGSPLVLIKYGGNAMKNEALSNEVIANCCKLVRAGHRLVLVHGGGPFIAETLKTYQIPSEFVAGQRKTSTEAMPLVEMALKGRVNGMLVRKFNAQGVKAVGLSGKDGGMVTATKRYHRTVENGREVELDLGWVGQISNVDTSLIHLLLDHSYLPVITCIASDKEGNDYNINGDIMAGKIAGALRADHYIVLTDVEGIMEDPAKPDSLIEETSLQELKGRYADCIKGGMIPKTESCELAISQGAGNAYILNGTDPSSLTDLLVRNKRRGTRIHN